MQLNVTVFLYVCLGVQVKYDLSQPDGSRVIELKLRKLDGVVAGYETVNPSKPCTVLITEFLAAGGDGYTMLARDRIDYKHLGKFSSLQSDMTL